MIRTKARMDLTHFGPPSRAKSHNFDQETIFVMSAMRHVSSLLLHLSSSSCLSCFEIRSLICLEDGHLSSFDSELDVRSNCVKLVSKCSSSSRHSRTRQTDLISSDRANRICELSVSAMTDEQSVIHRRKQSFLIKQQASADSISITIIEAVLEYHFGNLRALLPSYPRKELRTFRELSQRDQFSHP